MSDGKTSQPEATLINDPPAESGSVQAPSVPEI